MLGDVAGLYNRSVADVPNCWPVEEADFAGAIAAVTGGESDGGPSVEDQALSVAVLGGNVVGFAHTGIDRRDPDEAPRGAICFLCYERGCREAGQKLLAAAELPHVDLDFDLTVAWLRERGLRPGCQIKAYRDGETIGECEIACGGDYSRHPDARDFGFVWLGVEEPYQHRGLGKLLLFRARNEMLAAGYRHTAISTARHNNRAFLFYSNHGYRFVDWTCQLSKSLDRE